MKIDTDTRKIILQAALGEFASQGFDGARMEAIAAAAGIRKSLIYYYFKGKEEILTILMDDFFHQAQGLIMEKIKGLRFEETARVDELFEAVFLFLENGRPLLQILFQESLRDSPRTGETPLFRFLDMYMGTGLEQLLHMAEEMHIPVDPSSDHGQLRVTEFFTLVGPILMYIVFKDKWMGHYGVSREVLRTQFLTALRATHIAYHHK